MPFTFDHKRTYMVLPLLGRPDTVVVTPVKYSEYRSLFPKEVPIQIAYICALEFSHVKVTVVDGNCVPGTGVSIFAVSAGSDAVAMYVYNLDFHVPFTFDHKRTYMVLPSLGRPDTVVVTPVKYSEYRSLFPKVVPIQIAYISALEFSHVNVTVVDGNCVPGTGVSIFAVSAGSDAVAVYVYNLYFHTPFNSDHKRTYIVLPPPGRPDTVVVTSVKYLE